jgi:5-methylcytosine-specific restriction endonuclease McrA
MQPDKVCRKCGAAKPLEQFPKSKGYVLNACKSCEAERKHSRAKSRRKKLDPESRREYKRLWARAHQEEARRYYAANAERIRERNASRSDARREVFKRHYAENAEHIKANSRKWNAENTERKQAYRKARAPEAREYARRWRENNPDKIKAKIQRLAAKTREYARRWRENNPDKVKAKTQRRNASKRGAKGSHTAAEWSALVERFHGYCVCCREHFGLEKLTADHVIPLSKGGSNFIANIQPLCGPCNYRKSDRHSTDYRKSFEAPLTS